jgi:serine/threonine-protein kinase
MVMEFLEGGDLAAWVEQRGRLPVEQAVEFVLQASVAVADAHGLGIVHRDLKPANLFCVRRTDGQLLIKVLDFGISKVTQFGASGPGVSVTKTSALMGSPLYMSPEQMQSSKAVDSATDIWALGIILFELLTGQTPFAGETLPEVVLNIATRPPPSLATFRADVPVSLEAVILRCLEKDARARYRNIGEFAVALLPFAPQAKTLVERISGIMQASGLSASAMNVPPSPRVGGTLMTTAETTAPVGQTLSNTPGIKAAVVIAAFLGTIAFAIGGFVFLSRKGSSGHDPQATASAVTAASPPAAAAAPPSVDPEAPKDVPPPPPPPVAAPTEVPDAKAVSAASRPATSVVAPPVVQRTPQKPKATAPATPGAPNAASKSCDPPYYYDANRNRVFKKECM